MRDELLLQRPVRERLRAALKANAPVRGEVGLALLSSLLLICSFPDFNLWPLAWVGLAPLIYAVARRPQGTRAFLLGWLAGTLFFYGTCYWLTYAMIRYGGIPAWVAYPLLFPATVVVGLFPATFCLALARLVKRFGVRAIFIAPVLWAALEWARLGATGQLWNAIGYSQAYHPALIQTASWGGVYAVGFLIVAINAAISYWLLNRGTRDVKIPVAVIAVVALVMFAPYLSHDGQVIDPNPTAAVVVAVQPNVPMDSIGLSDETQALINRHVTLSEQALDEWKNKFSGPNHSGFGDENINTPRVVVWPESPMNFAYARDTQFREFVASFAAKNHTSVLFNSLEPAPANGAYNAAVMVNEEGRLIAQYDKIRLLPFGEYVPLPRWLPGVNLIPTMVGDFTPGAEYPLMPVGEARAGVFICFESAFPSVAREFAKGGADVLINISNDGYLGPTPVMRQHLANAVFRAVENNRPVLRVTNTGISALITAQGEVRGATAGFQTEVRTWTVHRATSGKTFYTKYGDLFALVCASLSTLAVAMTFKVFNRRRLTASE